MPIYGGTHDPPERSRGRSGFVELLGRISERWSTEREKITALSDTMLTEMTQRGAVGEPPGAQEAAGVLAGLVATWDPEHLGRGGRTPFPMTPRLQFLSSAIAARPSLPGRAQAESALRRTLDVIESGGLHDHLSGFHRCTDLRHSRGPVLPPLEGGDHRSG